MIITVTIYQYVMIINVDMESSSAVTLQIFQVGIGNCNN